MAKEVEVIFTEDKRGVFKIGQKKRVKMGYARNYLLPQGLAVIASSLRENELGDIEKKAQARLTELKASAEAVAPKINGQTVNFEVKTHNEGKLYGSVSTQDVAEKINTAFDVTIDRYDLRMPNVIREIGTYEVAVDVHSDVAISITLVITSENETITEAKPVAKEEEQAVSEDETAEESEEEDYEEVEA